VSFSRSLSLSVYRSVKDTLPWKSVSPSYSPKDYSCRCRKSPWSLPKSYKWSVLVPKVSVSVPKQLLLSQLHTGVSTPILVRCSVSKSYCKKSQTLLLLRDCTVTLPVSEQFLHACNYLTELSLNFCTPISIPAPTITA
jgi:hypothetical protein